MRDIRIDFLRGIAIIGIILIHIHSYYVFFHSIYEPPQLFTLFLANLSRFSVPVFIFSSGYFLQDKPFFEYWKNKILSIFIPYFIVATISLLIKFGVQNFFNSFYLVFTGEVMEPYYFIPLLFQLYIIHYFFLRYISNKPILLVILILSLIVNIYSNLQGFSYPWSFYHKISPTNFIFFFILGYTIRNVFYNYESFTKDKIFMSLVLFFLIISIFYIGNISFVHKKELSNHTIIYPTLMIFFILSIPYVENNFSKWICSFGQNSIAIFLLHPILIHFMHYLDPYLFGGAWISILIITFLNAIIPYFIWRVIKIIQFF